MEEKEVLQQDVVEQEAQPQIDLSTEIDGDVAQFDQQPQVEVVTAPPVEIPSGDIAKDIKEVDDSEKEKIEEAQKKANKEYHAVFGDRQIRKPSKTISLVIAIVAFLFVGIFIITKIPLFYNCLVPTNKQAMLSIFEETNIKEVESGSDVWLVWYEYDEDTGFREFNQRLPGSTFENPIYPSDEIFADLDEEAVENAVEYCQQNWLVDKKLTNQALAGEAKYVTIIWYQFDSLEESKEFAEKQEEKYGGEFEEKNVIFHQMGMVRGSAENHEYLAWYNGQFFVEVYASDEDLLKAVRNKVNYA